MASGAFRGGSGASALTRFAEVADAFGKDGLQLQDLGRRERPRPARSSATAASTDLSAHLKIAFGSARPPLRGGTVVWKVRVRLPSGRVSSTPAHTPGPLAKSAPSLSNQLSTARSGAVVGHAAAARHGLGCATDRPSGTLFSTRAARSRDTNTNSRNRMLRLYRSGLPFISRGS